MTNQMEEEKRVDIEIFNVRIKLNNRQPLNKSKLLQQ